MTSKEKSVVAMLGCGILTAIADLMLFAPIGSLGSADGPSYEVDRFGIIGYLLLLLVAGVFAVRWQSRQQAKSEVQEAGPDQTIWPPPIKEPGTGSAGLLLSESVSDTEEKRTEKV